MQGCETGETTNAQHALDCRDVSSGLFFNLLTERFSSDPYDATEREQDSSLRELCHRLTLASERTRALIELRGRLLCGLGVNPSWAAIDAELMATIHAWFDSDLLELRRIDGRAAGAVLDSLIKYEAVHQIRDDRDLKRRLAADRRCFGFFHPALPDEPLIFTELALTAGLSAKVQLLLDPDSTVLDPRSCDSAMFYSISSCHEGLRGVRLGTTLIRRVVDRLHREFRQLKAVATLSPIPGFRPWLADGARDGNRRFASLIARMEETNWMRDAELEHELIPLCEAYLLQIKRGTEPADPVARFHLSNGARLERLNWLGDTSAAGMARSAGITANYRYRFSDSESEPLAS